MTPHAHLLEGNLPIGPVRLINASGGPLAIEGRGVIHPMLPSCLLVPEVVQTLIGTSRLNAEGKSVLHLSATHPLAATGEATGFIFNDDGVIISLIDKEMTIDLDNIRESKHRLMVDVETGGDVSRPTPNINQIEHIQGYSELNVESAVWMIIQSFQTTLTNLRKMCAFIEHFPVTHEQVVKYFRVDPARVSSQMRRTSVKHRDRNALRRAYGPRRQYQYEIYETN